MKILFCFVLLFFSLSLTANATEKADVLRQCEQFFGKPVDEKLDLFEINSLFVLRAEFNRHDELTALEISSKYYFEEQHPEWKEPDERPKLSSIEYEDILPKLETIKPKGALVSSSPFGIVTNNTIWVSSFYENSYWDRGSNSVWDDAEDNVIGYTIRSLRISFMSRVEGVVFKKKARREAIFDRRVSDTGPVFKVSIESEPNEAQIRDYKTYYVSEETFKSLKHGKRQTFRGALIN